jgi:hypothetical protein
MERDKEISNLLNSPCTKRLDLTDESVLLEVISTAELFLQKYSDADTLQAFEEDLLLRREEVPLLAHLAVKLAKSKAIVSATKDLMHVSVVFAVYKEHTRIREKSVHPHGENFLVRKVAQLQWLFQDAPNFSWDLTVVDDGCPEGSGEIALSIIQEKQLGERVQVLFLKDAIENRLPIASPLQSTDESRKGGAIHYGLWNAIQTPRKNHVVVFTDADLSTHLGQIGLLINGIVNHQGLAAIGSRREPASIVLKEGKRNARGKLFIYLWKRVIHVLPGIIDTQCGFKMFRADLLREILQGAIEKGFAFDIELLLKTELNTPESIVKVPVTWIDSEAASTTTDLQPYLTMLQSMVVMYRRCLPANPESDAFAAFIDVLTEPLWNDLLSKVPGEILSREPQEFEEFDAVSASDLKILVTS